MGSTYLGLKEEELWVDLILLSIRMKKGRFSQVRLTKESFLSVIGLLDLLINQEAKMIQSLAFGVNRDASDQLSPLTYSPPTKILS